MNGKASMLLGTVLLFGVVGVVRAGLFEDLSEKDLRRWTPDRR